MNSFSYVDLRFSPRILIFFEIQSKPIRLQALIVSYYIKKSVYGLDGKRILQNENEKAFCSTIAGRVR